MRPDAEELPISRLRVRLCSPSSHRRKQSGEATEWVSRKAEKDDESSDARNGATEARSGTAKVSAARLSRVLSAALRFDLGSVAVPAAAGLALRRLLDTAGTSGDA